MNKWKIAFFTLAGGVALIVGVVLFLLFSPVEQGVKPTGEPLTGSVVALETTAEEFEMIARQYVGPSLAKSPLPVDFAIQDDIQLYSSFSVFSVAVPITMHFEPIVEENGNITLEQTKMNVGNLNIPPATMLKFLNDSVELPEFITVNAKDEQIFVDLSRINIANGSRVRAKEIDLENDKIVLEMVVQSEE